MEQQNRNQSITAPLTLGAFDLETTGIDASKDRIVTAAFIWLHPDGTHETFEWIVNPGIEIAPAAAEVHGISNEYAREHGMDPRQALTEISALFNAAHAARLPIVGHNVSYDLTMLTAELRRYGLPALPWFPVLDTIVLDKVADKYRKGSRTLTATAQHYDVVLENAHAADADALASGLIFRKLAEKYPEKLNLPLPELHAAQVAWRREQQEGLESYLRRKKNDASITIEKAWPVYLEELEARNAA